MNTKTLEDLRRLQREREIREDQAKQQTDMLPYCQIQEDDGSVCMTETYKDWPSGVPCATEEDKAWVAYRVRVPNVQSTFEDSAVSRTGVKEMLDLWNEAMAYAKEHGISPQDALCGFPFSEGY